MRNATNKHQYTKDGKQTIDGYWLVNDWNKGSKSDVQKWCYGTTGVRKRVVSYSTVCA